MYRCRKRPGFVVDKDLKFEQHINETVKKANKIALSRHDHTLHSVLVSENKDSHEIKMIPLLFTNCFRPAVSEYSNVVWAPCLKKNKKKERKHHNSNRKCAKTSVYQTRRRIDSLA